MKTEPKTAAHTPGPWTRLGLTVWHGLPAVGSTGIIANCNTAKPRAEDEANARLIEQAPAMLAALCKIAYEPIGDPEATHAEMYADMVGIAREAIYGKGLSRG